jgi:DNA-binding transcriptional LysR family regulator
MSYQAAPAIRDGRLAAILNAYAPEPIPVHLIHSGPPLLPLKLRAFLDFAAPRLRSALAGLPA